MRTIVAVLVLWFPLSVAAIVAIPVLLWGVLSGDESTWRPVGRAMDKLLATLLGYSGDHTLSAELGASTDYRRLHDLLNMIEPQHCEKSAKKEGVL